jgi:hypothetical protein
VVRSHDGPFMPLHALTLAPYGSKEQEQQLKEDREYTNDFVRRHLRGAYFSVADIKLRKRLMVKHRQLHEADLSMVREELREARSALLKAQRRDWFTPAFLAVCIVLIGYVTLGVSGAIAGAIAGFFVGRSVEEAVRRDRRVAIARAQEEVRAKDELVRVTTEHSPLFSLDEETGQPDQGSLEAKAEQHA